LVTAATGAADLEVTAIANEGFLVRAAGKAVLVDALFRATAPHPDFYQQGPSETLLMRMISGEGEFSRVDLVLVTHHHADHFDAATAVAFLRRHAESVLIGTDSVREAMAELAGFAEVSDRVLAPSLDWATCAALPVNGVDVRVCRARHSGIPSVTNLVYRVDLSGVSFVHEGDVDLSDKTFTGLGLAEDGLDLAFLHSWWVSSDEGRSATLRDLHPSRIVLMHHRWALAQEARDRVEQLPVEGRKRLPPVSVFGAESERRTFQFNSRGCE
jgi:L-ascorbate metabolism protein UlaG (beta-lactamase superfamily)